MRLFRIWGWFLFFLLYPFDSFSQGVVTGRVADAGTGEPLPGAAVYVSQGKGTTTRADGTYLLRLPAGEYLLYVKFVGYRPVERKVNIPDDDTLVADIFLHPSEEQLSEVVVSADKFSQRLSEVNVSMTVVRPREMELDNAVSLDAVLNKISGVDILDGQPSIRGGSGYSYGAGSRVLVVVDGLPLLSGDAGDVKWDFLPMESLSQMEVIKGASSVLYGSSALNGVIRLRTVVPGPQPVTQVRLYSGVYLPPRRREMMWWEHPRWWAGASFLHARTQGRHGLVAGGDLFRNTGYRQDEYARRVRLNGAWSFRPSRVRGLSLGVAFNGMFVDKSSFFLWQDADSGAWKQAGVGVSPVRGYRLYVDPHLSYTTPSGAMHVLRTRYFSVNNHMTENPDKDNHFNSCMAEYRYQRKVGRWRLSAGLFEHYNRVFSRLYGNHHSNEAALYFQVHGRAGERLSFTAGGRWEIFGLDTFDVKQVPVFRAGLNYRLGRATRLRLSGGQGYRYPSVAEKFTATSLGALNIFPNPWLRPEKGWSTETGVMQPFRAGKMEGFADVSFFMSGYRDMIEFLFGMYLPEGVTTPSLKYVGFKALNVEKARISGVEVQAHLERREGTVTWALHAGYLFLHPVDLNISDAKENILKYRYRHAVKGSAEGTWRNWTAGMTMVWRSFMERVDSVFVDPFLGNLILPGYPEYRENHRRGRAVFDLRTGYLFEKKWRLYLVCKNLFNEEVMGRPGDIRPPRTIEMQMVMRW